MMTLAKLLCLSLVVTFMIVDVNAQARRVRLRPRPVAVNEDQLQYYEAEDRGEDEDVVIVNQDEQPFIYTRPLARQDNYIRPSAAPASIPKPRTKESAKAPPVQTIRNYNKVNDDGSFTFGYEAADGSFKEETRGTDCVVRGKYGYIDPDGNKREFTYVSGNPCDPNAQTDDDEELDIKDESNESLNEPANYPVRPPRPLSTPRPTTTVFQNDYRHGLRGEVEDSIDEAPRTLPPRPKANAISITPRPTPPATTFRPQLLQITQRPQTVTPRPQLVYSSIAPSAVVTTPTPFKSSPSPRPAGHIDFAAEFAKFQQENQIAPSPAAFKTKDKTTETISSTGNPIFSTQLVYDPSSGQYDSRLFQTLPQTNGDFTLSHRAPQAVSRPLIEQPSYRPSQPVYQQQQYRSPQEVYQRQQSELQFQNSQQLYAQQQQLQQSRLIADRQAARAAFAQASQRPPQYYIVSPNRDQQSPIDAFLRGHNIQF